MHNVHNASIVRCACFMVLIWLVSSRCELLLHVMINLSQLHHLGGSSAGLRVGSIESRLRKDEPASDLDVIHSFKPLLLRWLWHVAVLGHPRGYALS